MFITTQDPLRGWDCANPFGESQNGDDVVTLERWTVKAGIQGRRLYAGWDHDYLLRLIQSVKMLLTWRLCLGGIVFLPKLRSRHNITTLPTVVILEVGQRGRLAKAFDVRGILRK